MAPREVEHRPTIPGSRTKSTHKAQKTKKPLSIKGFLGGGGRESNPPATVMAAKPVLKTGRDTGRVPPPALFIAHLRRSPQPHEAFECPQTAHNFQIRSGEQHFPREHARACPRMRRCTSDVGQTLVGQLFPCVEYFLFEGFGGKALCCAESQDGLFVPVEEAAPLVPESEIYPRSCPRPP